MHAGKQMRVLRLERVGIKSGVESGGVSSSARNVWDDTVMVFKTCQSKYASAPDSHQSSQYVVSVVVSHDNHFHALTHLAGSFETL